MMTLLLSSTCPPVFEGTSRIDHGSDSVDQPAKRGRRASWTTPKAVGAIAVSCCALPSRRITESLIGFARCQLELRFDARYPAAGLRSSDREQFFHRPESLFHLDRALRIARPECRAQPPTFESGFRDPACRFAQREWDCQFADPDGDIPRRRVYTHLRSQPGEFPP